MSTIFTNTYAINGVISTDKTVLQNLIAIANASACWVTYDITVGKWSVIINKPASAMAAFNDNNIIGGINISETGINELYNEVTVEFPHATIRDQTDFITIKLDPLQRFPNEVDNTLNLQYDCINSPVQAQLLGNLELRQSRVNKIIQFRTDFSKLGLQAGDVISVTNEMYGFVTKPFRITKIEEDDSEGLSLSITALEYSDDIYIKDSVVYTDRKKNTGILIQEQNDVIRDLDDQDWSSSFIRMLGATAATSLLNMLFQRNPLTGKIQQILAPKEGIKDQILSTMATLKPTITVTPSTVCEGATVLVKAEICVPSCSDPNGLTLDYQITGVEDNDIGVPRTGKIILNSQGKGELSIPITLDNVTEGTETMVVKVGTAQASVSIKEKLAFTYVTSASPETITAGGSSTVTLTTTGVPAGTVVPYKISGSGASIVTNALIGNVTVNGSGVATLTVNTNSNPSYTGAKSITVTFNEDLVDSCGDLDKTASITINDNNPTPPPDLNCEFVTVPLVWCGKYDGTSGQLKSVTAAASVKLPKPLPGEASTTVPLTVSVTGGAINVLTTATVATTSSIGGIPVQVIKTFNSVSANGPITGTTQTFYGFFD